LFHQTVSEFYREKKDYVKLAIEFHFSCIIKIFVSSLQIVKQTEIYLAGGKNDNF